MMRPPSIRPAAQRGLALASVLLLLAAAMVIGVAVARGAFALLASARNEGDRVTARLAAEAALLDAERDLAGAGLGADADAAARAALLAQAEGAGFADGCGRGPADLGLCRVAAPPAWQDIDLTDPEADVLVPYGRYTGAVLPLGAGTLPARLPGYLIEKLAPAGADPAQGGFYRITAIGFGMRASTQVVLQSLFRQAAPAAPGTSADEEGEGGGAPADGAGDDDDPGAGPDPPRPPAAPPPPPAGRIGWREIANWPELHARAQQ
ncbi:pilus assembly protein [Massilia sp. YIM B02763]|uniref:pilus assembly protein n=1 Tax=Massilia sp. YIM B02763 TaxID=3050130 RepID=UPI0025B6EB45|nr:pilus assembly protein [Massilia sp. YIM B02763]MDN4052301.1 pilus assembly protein [Massilia sp. YIM B02763]